MLFRSRWAARSHQLAATATDEGRLAEEIVGVTVKTRKEEAEVVHDEAIRPETTVEVLAKLKPVGGPDATHTAGNAPGVNDGAGAVVVASEEWAKRESRSPLARILSYGTVADDFPYLARTPAGAAKQALEKIGRSPSDVDLWEINEAFASVAINSVRMLGVDEEKVMMVAIEAGADDVIAEGDGFRIMTDSHLVYDVKSELDNAGIEVISADSPMVSDNLVPITELKDAKAVLRILEALEDNDDVQDVFSNFDISDDLMEEAAS